MHNAAAVSWLFNDRQFLCRAVAVHFPDGTRALAVYSPPDFTHPLDPGVTKPRTVRAHMGISGYVVSPFAGKERSCLGADRCQLTMVLQVDPKVGALLCCVEQRLLLSKMRQTRHQLHVVHTAAHDTLRALRLRPAPDPRVACRCRCTTRCT